MKNSTPLPPQITRQLRCDKQDNTERLIFKRREFVRASIDAFKTLSEQRIADLYLYLIQEAMLKTKGNLIHLKFSHIRSILGKSGKAYTIKELKKLMKALSKKSVTINVIGKGETRYISFFGDITVKNDKTVSIEVKKSFIEDYFKQKPNFVRVLFSISQNSKHLYTPKLIEFLSDYLCNIKHTDVLRVLDLKSFKKLMGLINKDNKYEKYKLIFDLKKYVLEPARIEAEKFGFYFTYELINKNKRIRFSMKMVKQQEFKDYLNNVRNYDDTLDAKTQQENLKKYPKAIWIHKKEDEILTYVRTKTQEDTVKYLKEELLNIPEFNQKIRDIHLGTNWSMYVFEYIDQSYSKYELISFSDLEKLIEYFTRPHLRKQNDHKIKFIKNIINAPPMDSE